MSYAKERKKAFRELIHAIPASKFPLTEAEVVKLAWNIQEEIAAHGNKGRGRRLSLHKIFYVYVLMDPRKPGPWTYTLPGGKTITFPFLPIYVGKGIGKRMYDHVKEARNCKAKGKKLSHKENTILAIENSGLRVIEKILSEQCIEAVAFAKEIILIRTIGRRNLGTGSLTNLTNGGEGTSGRVISAKTRKKMSASRPLALARMSPEVQAEMKVKLSEKAIELAASRSEEYKREWRELVYAGQQNMSLEAREEWGNNMRAAYKAMPPDRKQERLDKIQATKASLPDIICPHCGTVGRYMGWMLKYHFDNCTTEIIPESCPHCGIEAVNCGAGNLKRWHLDNCRFKQQVEKDVLQV